MRPPRPVARCRPAAEVLKTAFTDKATVARIGGDEFVAILKNQESPQEFIDRMPALIALNNRYYQGPELRFSMGSATRKTNEALEKTLIRADEAMYRNKESRYRNNPAHEILGMSMDDIATCNRFAFESSFVDEKVKQRIWQKYFL